MNRKLSVLFIPLLFLSFAVVFTNSDLLVEKLESYLSFYTPEKVYLHTDKPYYSAGDTIWFSAYLVHGVSHLATAPSKIVYVELINEQKEVLARRDIGIENGSGAAEFALADTLAAGRYLLRGYTSFMRNFDQAYFFYKELRIAGLSRTDSLTITDAELPARPYDTTSFQVSDLVSVQFFPEGGDLVVGLWSTVGIKAIGPDGKGLALNGEVRNRRLEKVADFYTGGLGMGKFRFYPEMGETYTSSIRLGSQTIEKPFPKARSDGYVLTVSNLSAEHAAVKVEGTLPVNGGYLIAHVRGHVFLSLPADGEVLEALVPKKDLPEGIATFTWFDSQNRPQCERLVFIEHAVQYPELQVSGLNASYKRREKVSIDLHSPQQAVLSVAVTDKAKIHHEPGNENIRSYLLLNSDLRGEIENPGLYFDPENKTRLQDLDNLLLTQGWRRFTWKDVIEEKKPEVKHLAEPEGFSVAGRVVDFYNQKKPVVSKVTLTASNKHGEIVVDEAQTDSAGFFLFTSLDLADTTSIILQTPNEKKMARKGGRKEVVEGGEINLSTKILLTQFKLPQAEYQFEEAEKVEASKFFEAYLKEIGKAKEINAAFSFGKDVQVLEEIEVRDFRFRERTRFDRPAMLYTRPTHRIDADSLGKILLPMYAMDLVGMGKINGIRTVGSGMETNVSYRGGGARFFLDGSEVGPTMINSIPPARVDFIDVLAGPQALIYQVNVVILVYTKLDATLRRQYVPKGVSGFTHPGYYHARKFYTPDYSTKKESHVRTDVRPTLYWQAGLKTADGEPAKLEFYTSDVASTFEVRIEGITGEGRPFVKTEEFVVN